jgi:hypothetical protein
MPSPQTVERFVSLVEADRGIDALVAFYEENASMRENESPPRQGKAALLAHERAARASVTGMKARCVRPILIAGDVPIRQTHSREDPMSVDSVFKKLNLKQEQEILVVNAPSSFEPELLALEGVTVLRDPKKLKAIHFALVFATTQAEVDALSRVLASKAEGDAVLWFAYPKGTSKRYKCEFNRDTGWHAMRSAGFDTVRQVAIDEDWSALRFRRVEYIKPSS